MTNNNYTHYQDTNMGELLQLGVRFLDPSVGRFTQVDPVERNLYLYVYGADRVLLLKDPQGLDPCRSDWEMSLGRCHAEAWNIFEKCLLEKIKFEPIGIGACLGICGLAIIIITPIGLGECMWICGGGGFFSSILIVKSCASQFASNYRNCDKMYDYYINSECQ